MSLKLTKEKVDNFIYSFFLFLIIQILFTPFLKTFLTLLICSLITLPVMAVKGYYDSKKSTKPYTVELFIYNIIGLALAIFVYLWIKY